MSGYRTKSETYTNGVKLERSNPQGNVGGFKKFDEGKLRWNLLPNEALEEVLRIFEFGANKYGEFNWLTNSKGVSWTRYSNALERHLKKWKLSKDYDEESNMYELAHLITNGLMLLQYQILDLGKDDRDYRIGQKFGLLTVMEFVEIKHKTDRIYKMKCDCGKEVNVSYNNVLRGNTSSCGCLQKIGEK